MEAKADMRRSRPIPSLREFKQLTDERKERAYVAGYLALIGDGFPSTSKDKGKREQLLAGYQEEALWSSEQVDDLRKQAEAELATLIAK